MISLPWPNYHRQDTLNGKTLAAMFLDVSGFELVLSLNDLRERILITLIIHDIITAI
jgi:hypothetical protein